MGYNQVECGAYENWRNNDECLRQSEEKHRSSVRWHDRDDPDGKADTVTDTGNEEWYGICVFLSHRFANLGIVD